MVLCDIGNSFYHFYDNGKIWKIPINESPDIVIKGKKLYFISVNETASKKLLSQYPDAINLERHIVLDSDYEGLGIDRAAACKAIEDGAVVDAGSAITVDIMQNGMHLGGYILPGITEYKKMYENISPRLNKAISFDIATDMLPQNTADAISYGIIMPMIALLEKSAKNKIIYFTGGDGPYFSRFFPKSIVDNLLIFKGMLKIINEEVLIC